MEQTKTTIGRLAIFCYDNVLFTVLTEEYENRVDTILKKLPKDLANTHLEWFKLVPDEYISDNVQKTIERLNEARLSLYEVGKEWDKHGTAWPEYNKAWSEWYQAFSSFEKATTKCPTLKTYLEEQVASGCPWNEQLHCLILHRMVPIDVQEVSK